MINLKTGIPLEQETRFWDEQKNKTVLLRTKEKTRDYRFFPDPDLSPLKVTSEEIQNIETTLPELPDDKIIRFINTYQIPMDEAHTLASSKETADYFEQTVEYSEEPAEASHWILRDVFGFLKETHTHFSEFPVPPEDLAVLIKHIQRNELSRRTAKEIVFPEMIHTGKSASDIIKEQNLDQISNINQLKTMITDVLDQNQNQVSEYLNGKTQVIHYLIGQIMKQTQGRANPEMTKRLLIKILKGYNI
jgi:aspartyl-tRNA(Asn)/glutamyl-tRNA(Gln) amidotransferase subunit B